MQWVFHWNYNVKITTDWGGYIQPYCISVLATIFVVVLGHKVLGHTQK